MKTLIPGTLGKLAPNLGILSRLCNGIGASMYITVEVGAALENFPARKRKKVLVPHMQQK
jgi:hypothetical protein